MLTNMISKMDRAILELALVNAFADMCFYEGEEFITDLESYVKDLENKTNTKEQDNTFCEISMPYIEKSIMTYYEGVKDVAVPSDKNQGHVGVVPAEAGKFLSKTNKNEFLTNAGLGSTSKAKTVTTDGEELDVAAFEILGEAIYPSVKHGIDKAKRRMSEVGNNVTKAVTGGIISAKMFAKDIKGSKITGGKSATASPAKK